MSDMGGLRGTLSNRIASGSRGPTWTTPRIVAFAARSYGPAGVIARGTARVGSGPIDGDTLTWDDGTFAELL
jgi:hypothetical protein